LKKYKKTRNSDKALILTLWWYFHRDKFQRDEQGNNWMKIDDYFELENTETIRRMRQKFQEDGMYLSDKQIAEERAKKAKGVRFTINTPTYGEKYLPT